MFVLRFAKIGEINVVNVERESGFLISPVLPLAS